jgi:mRNA interferase RelE/StbE
MASQRKLKMSDEVRDLIRRLHPDIKSKVRMALAEITENPCCGKSLRGELQGMRSFRVNKFRIIYHPAAQVIEVIALGPRRSIYEETLRLLQMEDKGPGTRG